MNKKQQEDLKKALQLRDRVVRVLSEDGHFRAVAVKNSLTAQTAQENHNLDQTSAFFLSQALSGATLMSAFLKGEERIILEFEGAGPIRKVYAEALQVGETRGYVDLAPDAAERPVTAIGEAIGAGMLKVAKVLFDEPEPVTGIVPLVKGDIGSDLAHYFAQSEQIPTAVVLDVDFNENGIVKQSGGLMVQAMPGHSKEQLKEIYEALLKIKTIAGLYESEKNPLEVLRHVLPFDFNLISSSQVDFFCRCSKDSFKSKLITLGTKELISMQKEGHDKLVCQYCNSEYKLDADDFEQIIEESRAKRN